MKQYKLTYLKLKMKYIKTLILIFAALLILINVSAQNQQTEQSSKQTIQLSSQADTLQYAIGAYLGQWMVYNNFKVTNANVFLTGMDNVLKNLPLAINDSLITQLITTYQLSIQNEKNRQMEQELFASLKEKSGVGILPNGVNYIVAKAGTGIRPIVSDTVVFHVKGLFPDGSVFEDTYKNNQAITNVLSNLIPGLRETIQLMPEGSVWRIFIPSALAYGSAGLPNVVPPYTALVFDITLMEVKK